MDYIIPISIIIFSASILPIYFKFLVNNILKLLIRSSLGYISDIKYGRFSLSSLTILDIHISLSGMAISSLQIPKVKIYIKFFKILFTLPKQIYVNGLQDFSTLSFSDNPILSFNFLKTPHLRIERSIEIHLLDPSEQDLFAGKISLNQLDFKAKKILDFESIHLLSCAPTHSLISIRLDYVFHSNGVYDHEFVLDATLHLGTSKRTKTRFLQKLEINQICVIFKSCYIALQSGILTYHLQGEPSGIIKIEFSNVEKLLKIFCLPEYISASVTKFMKYMTQQKALQSNNKLEIKYKPEGIFINNISLDTIKKALNT